MMLRFSRARIGVGALVIGGLMLWSWLTGDTDSKGMRELGAAAPAIGGGLLLLGLVLLGRTFRRRDEGDTSSEPE